MLVGMSRIALYRCKVLHLNLHSDVYLKYDLDLVYVKKLITFIGL
jgi:hypothetical protein